MIDIFFIVNGSNDLYYSIKKSVEELYTGLMEIHNIRIYLFYKIVLNDPMKLWKKVDLEHNTLGEVGALRYLNKKIEELDTKEFFRETVIDGKKVSVMAPDLFLNKYINKDNNNVVVLGGHGGPFQCLLDMDVSPAVSLNTVLLAKRLKKIKIDLLFLDMCAMNYIEVIYELLSSEKISNIVTYKSIGPFLGINYISFVKAVVDNGKIDFKFYKKIKEAPLISVSKNNYIKMKEIKKIQNKLVKKVLNEENPVFDNEIMVFKEKFIELAEDNKYSKDINGLSVNYIKYFLSDKNERELYTQFEYVQKNLWRFIVTEDLKYYLDCNPECIRLEKNSIKDIIYLHNTQLSENEVNEKVDEFITYRRESNYYKGSF